MPPNVQLEHGHVRIPNRLYEAMLHADFSPTQFKLLHGIIRLSFGWGKTTVTASHAELAAAIGMQPSGAFRAALRELIAHGVVIEVEAGSGRVSHTLAIQKDFGKWGKWATHIDRLASRFGTRMGSNDAALQEISDRVPTSEHAQEQAPRPPRSRQVPCLEVGTVTGSNSFIGEAYEGGKTLKDSEIEQKAERVSPGESGAPPPAPVPHADADDRTEKHEPSYDDFPPDAAEFMRTFYPRGASPPTRRRDVAAQILATMGDGALFEGQRIRAGTPARLGSRCRDVLSTPPRDRNTAIVVLFRKLADSTDTSAATLARDAAEEQRAQSAAARDLETARAWMTSLPEIEAEIETRIVDEMGDAPADDGLTAPLRRMLRDSLVVAAWRSAEHAAQRGVA